MYFKRHFLLWFFFSSLLLTAQNIKTTETLYFGEQLFKGNFQSSAQFQQDPNYILKSGDVINIKIWGAYEFQSDLNIDIEGNIFIPQVGSIHVMGLKNSALQNTLNSAVRNVFNKNINVYAILKQYHPIFVFVSGSVNNVGLYKGFSKDSILQFIDKAKGIIQAEGSYRDIVVLRKNSIVKRFDLYQFLLKGYKNNFRFQNGDVILVNPIKNAVQVTGVVTRPYIFEFSSKNTSVETIMHYALPNSSVNQFIHTYKIKTKELSKTYSISDAKHVLLKNGDSLKFFSNQYATSISISIEGEHKGARYRSIKKGTSLYAILKEVYFSPLSNIQNIQLFRKSVASMEKILLDKKLQALEAKALTTESSSPEEATIRSKENALVMEFIKRAKEIEPKGQIILNKREDLRQIILHEGDRIFIPQKSNIIITQGEVNIPQASTFKEGENLDYYINKCGGFTQRANRDKILIIKANGEVIESKNSFFTAQKIELGDAILVLSKSDTKNLIFAKDITQIIYQVAVGAAVILRAF